jgi:hypothetical protein
MSKTVLEQALDHLLNKEEDKASALLHDYYVGIGRQVYEDIMADDINFEDEDLEAVTDAVEEVEADLTEEGEEEAAPEFGDGEEEATDDLGADLGADEAAPVDAEAADVADAMLDVESALAKLKAEFEQMVSGEEEAPEAEAELGAEEEVTGEEMPESIEESAELTRVSNPDNGDKADEKRSPVAGKNPVGARPAVSFGAGSAVGTASGTSPAKAPSAQDLGGTTKPALAKVAKPGTTPGREAGSSSDVLPKGRG